MKDILLLILCIMTFSVTSCNNDERCHYDVQILNNTENQIVFAIPIQNANNKYRLDGVTINSRSQYKYRPYNFCIENSINGSVLDIYIVDTSNFNMPNVFYNYDSIEINNKVLKHYMLTLDDLKNMNWEINYP